MGGGGGGGGEGRSGIKMAAVTGSAVVLEMLCGGLAMENAKMEKQRTSLPYRVIFRNIFSAGLGGVWAGFWPWGFALGVTKGTVLGGSRAFLLDVCTNRLKMEKGTADLVSGFGAGGVQGVFMSPVLLARTRVNQSLTERAARAAAASPGGKLQTGLMQEMRLSASILNDGIRQDGWGVLFKGMPAMVFKRSMDWGTRFIFINQFTDLMKSARGDPKRKLNDVEKLVASFVGGSASCAVTMPVDRMMPILQQAASGQQSAMAYIRDKMRTEGLGTLQRGLLMRAMHTGYHTTFAIFVADKMYGWVSK